MTTDNRYVIYTLTADNDRGHLLAVEDSREDAIDTMDKWWLAFKNGEKTQPDDYNGISFTPLPGNLFTRWDAPDDTSGDQS